MTATPFDGRPSADARRLSVVIATRDRHQLLERVIASLRSQCGADLLHVIIVDDGSRVAVRTDILQELHGDVIRTGGEGPARARNIGWRRALTDWVVFLDDDVELSSRWLDAVFQATAEHPEALCIEGPVVSPPFDPLYEYSIVRDGPGWGLTCNVAYSRTALQRNGGFFEGFPYPHCEDVDLYHRVMRHGTGAWSEAMQVVHPPRVVPLREFRRRGRWAASELLLEMLHPGILGAPRGVPRRWAPLWVAAEQWVRLAARERTRLMQPRRAARLVAAAAMHLASTTAAVLRWRPPPAVELPPHCSN